VVTQFAISQILIVTTIVAVSQMDFIRTADLGFDQEAVLLLPSSSDSAVMVKHAAFKQELLKIPGVRLVSICSDIPSSDNNSATNFAFNHKPDENFSLYLKFGDADYFKTFDLKMVAGEPYRMDDTSRKVVVNETLLRKLNVSDPQTAIGMEIRMGGGRWRKICGVVKDFKTNSLRETVKPLLIGINKHHMGLFSVKLHTSSLKNSQDEIQKVWDKFFPDYAYSSSFMEEHIQSFYRQEEQMSLLYKIFASLAILISCLGLYGLVSFMAVQKTKEVGIRKVLGAGISNIVFLFSKEFTWLIAVAFVIAAPLAWYFMNSWLDNFAYRVHIGWTVFLIAILASMLVAWISVGYKALRAAVANPIKSLRTE
jgi:putative ABC transport system permease protein